MLIQVSLKQIQRLVLDTTEVKLRENLILSANFSLFTNVSNTRTKLKSKLLSQPFSVELFWTKSLIDENQPVVLGEVDFEFGGKFLRFTHLEKLCI